MATEHSLSEKDEIASPSDAQVIERRPFLFIRHGQTESNLRKVTTGQRDVALTARGVEQAEAAAAVLKRLTFDMICTSPLKRARQTAAIIAERTGHRVADPIIDLMERRWGEAEGRPRAEKVEHPLPLGAEPLDQFRARTFSGLREATELGQVLIVAHSGIYRVIAQKLGLLPQLVKLPNAQPVIISPSAGSASWQVDVCAMPKEASRSR
ncbi:histidine phosphatase family protein [Pelagibius sp.]|uniref:histidine phosphatase family protein n=1 Tax=Pelagibius sp. TaxID=1931238 RepID=UPI003BAF22ED